MHADPSWPFVAAPDHPLLSAFWEVVAHGALAVLVVLPLVWRSSRRSRLLLFAFLGGLALDLDHALAAGSIDPASMEQLGRRPDTHSLLFVAGAALIGFAVSRRPVFAWGVNAVLVSHLLLDAPGGAVPWLFPLEQPESIPWLACPLGILLLLGISAAVAHSPLEARASRRGRLLVDPHPVDQHPRGELGGGVG
jgi:peptidoglycan/LPS O-acetylase OafA/YrhL